MGFSGLRFTGSSTPLMAGCTAGFTLSLERGESTCRGGPLARPDATGSAQDAKASRYDSVKLAGRGWACKQNDRIAQDMHADTSSHATPGPETSNQNVTKRALT